MPPRLLSQVARLALAACLILLSACSTRISIPEDQDLATAVPDSWAERQQQLLAFDRWQLMGKIAVRQADQSESAVINQWRQDQAGYHLQLSSAFLGMGSVELQGDENLLLIRTGDGEQYFSDDPEELTRQVTGWRLPLSALRYWVRGIPAPQPTPELAFGPEGQLRKLVQSGWEVHFERFSDAPDGLTNLPALPGLVTATNGDARIRLAINRWQPIASDT